MPFVNVGRLSELPPGVVMEFERGEELYAICNVDGEVRALWGRCPHQGGPLGEGALHKDKLTCPWHMWPFDSKTGECALNVNLRIPVYPVRVVDGAIEVDLPEEWGDDA